MQCLFIGMKPKTGGHGIFRRCTLLEEVQLCGELSESIALSHFLFFLSLFPRNGWKCDQPASYSCRPVMPSLPWWTDSPSRTVSQNKLSTLGCFWSQYFYYSPILWFNLYSLTCYSVFFSCWRFKRTQKPWWDHTRLIKIPHRKVRS